MAIIDIIKGAVCQKAFAKPFISFMPLSTFILLSSKVIIKNFEWEHWCPIRTEWHHQLRFYRFLFILISFFPFSFEKKKKNETKKFLKKIVSQVMAILRWLNSRQRKINPFSFCIFLNVSYVQNSVMSHRVLACLRSSNKSNRTGDRLNEQSAASAIIVCWTSYIWLCPEWQMAANIAQLFYYT